VEFRKFPDSFLDGNYYLVDSNLRSRFTPQPKNVIFVEADEERKTLGTAESLILDLSIAGMTKGDKLVVVGGGYLQDIGTLVASLYMRGVKWDYYPTTLAAMGDSCIGGKVGVNHHSKNMLGMFVSPQKVIISDYFFKTLSHDMIISGLGESLKLSIIGGLNEVNNFIKLYEKNDYLTIIKQSLVIKKAIIEYDELEKNERRVLNYGHTIGHAIEATTNFFIPHGIAVLFGMYYINKIFRNIHPIYIL
jgi:3-dehydroquinate synthase